MENSLVNPLWIYLIDVLSNIGLFLWILFLILIVICVVFAITLFCGVYDGFMEEDDIEYKFSKRWFKTTLILSITVATFALAIPSEKTMYTMFVSSYLTEENITSATESVTDVVDYIFEKVDQLQNDEGD